MMTKLRLWLFWFTALWALLPATPFVSQGMFAYDCQRQAVYEHTLKPVLVYDPADRLTPNKRRSQAVNPCPLLATCAESVAAKTGLATGTDEAVFWSGIGRGGDARAATWAAQNGGATLESTLASRGITLPAWDASNPATLAAWRQASVDFAAGARGNVRVLQGDALRVDAIWRDEFRALQANPNVNSIRAINPDSGAGVSLWSR